MAVKIENIGNKIIMIGEAAVLPGETKEVPRAYETSPILEVYRLCGAAKITGSPLAASRTARSAEKERAMAEKKAEEERKAAENKKAAAEKKAADDAEALRQARLASLNGISDDALVSLAKDLGINFADCKDQADMLKKVKAALKK